MISRITHSFALAAVALLALASPASAACSKVAAGYYTSWSEGYYPSSQIPYNQLNYIIHAFIEENTDGSISIPSGFLDPNLITSAHAAGAKVLVSVGGSSWAAAYPTLASSSTATANFANQLLAFCQTYGYDGVDIDWEFPDTAAKSANFDTLVQTIRSTFNAAPAPAPGYAITAALSADLYYAGFLNFSVLKNSLTYFNIMAYDYYGPWSSSSGNVAGLYPSSLDPSHSNADQSDSINYYLANGAPANQILMGLPFYGYEFPVPQLYQSCSCSSTNTYAYSSIAPMVGNGWTANYDNSAQSPYLTNGSQVITYENPTSILAKANWAVNTAGLAGVFTWALDQDYLGPGNQPLLSAMTSQVQACQSPTNTPTPVVASTWRVNAGGPQYTDTLGQVWSADENYSGGTAASTSNVVNAPNATLYETERYGTFSYTFDVPPGSYQLSLLFAEVYFTTTGQREFNVFINGSQVLTNFDVVAAAGGPLLPVDKVFDNISPVNGSITIGFTVGAANYPKLSALQLIPEVTPTPSPTSTPSRTPTASPSATPSATPSHSPTASPTASPTGTPSSTITQSPLTTPTDSFTQTPNWTATVTPTATQSFTTSPTPTISPDESATPSVSPSATPSSTATLTASPSATQTATASPSVTLTSTPSPTASATPTATPSWTASPRASATPSSTASPSVTQTLTPAPSGLVTTTPPATPNGHQLRILQQSAWPNPGPSAISLLLEAPASRVRVRIWTKSFTLALDLEAGQAEAGWFSVPLPPSALSGLGAGLYFYTVEAWNGDVQALGLKPGTLWIRKG